MNEMESEIFDLWEVDIVLKKVYDKVGENKSIEEARILAKYLAKDWCVDEEPKQYINKKTRSELCIGDSDFGILIRKSNNKDEE